MGRRSDRWPAGFPWMELVFCLACLATAAWTWMRHSYAWDVTPGQLERLMTYLVTRDARIGEAGRVAATGVPWRHREFLHCGSPCPGMEGTYVRLRGRYPDDPSSWMMDQDESGMAVPVRLSPTYLSKPLVGDIIVAGRIVFMDGHPPSIGVDTTYSRFHPASFAGLVVGAMGCFIFGLYLRRWLVERPVLASEPGPEAIA